MGQRLSKESLHIDLTKDDASTRACCSSVEMSQERVDTDTQCSSLTPSSGNSITTRTKESVVATRHQVTSIIRSTRSE